MSNTRQNIRATEKRIQKLAETKKLGYTGWAFEGGRVEANMEKNRLPIFFDEIPDAETRQELKGQGFRWARSEGAWQRQLTDNAIYAASRIKAIQPSDGSNPIKIQPKPKNSPARQDRGTAMNVLVVEPGFLPYEQAINGLPDMSKIVGGPIQAIAMAKSAPRIGHSSRKVGNRELEKALHRISGHQNQSASKREKGRWVTRVHSLLRDDRQVISGNEIKWLPIAIFGLGSAQRRTAQRWPLVHREEPDGGIPGGLHAGGALPCTRTPPIWE